MKSKVIIFSLLCLIFVSCKKAGLQEQDIIYMHQSNILGQLRYVANPCIYENDSVLCLKDIKYVDCKAPTDEYYSYLKDLFSKCEGTLDEGDYPGMNDNLIHFQPASDVVFYPIRDGKFISVIDTQTGARLDSIFLPVVIERGNRTDHSTIIVHLETRTQEETDDYSPNFYIGDYVAFEGNDFMRPKFITDSVTPSGEQIVCFDGTHGPIMAFQSIGGEIIDF